MKIEMPTDEDLHRLLGSPPLDVAITGLSALHVLGALQLVLRHPDFNESSAAATTRKLAERLEAFIVAASPGMTELCAMGWNPDAELAERKS